MNSTEQTAARSAGATTGTATASCRNTSSLIGATVAAGKFCRARVLSVLREAQAYVSSSQSSPSLAGEFDQVHDAVAALLASEAALAARNAELERLCDSTYVAQGADAYHHACEVMEAWQEARCAAGKDPGCEGSLCDGLSWLQIRITKTEAERDALAAAVGALRLDAERWQTIRDSRSSITLSLHCTAPSERERFIDALRAEAGHG